MKASVIICTYSFDRYDDVLNCIESILRQSYENYEIVIAVDKNEKLARALRNKYDSKSIKIVLNEGRKGLSINRNLGISSATGEVVVFIDDDAYADNFWLEKLMSNYVNNPCVKGVGGYAKPIWEEGEVKWFPDELNWIVGCTYEGHPKTKTSVRNLIGCNMSFKREIFNEIGFFRPEIGRVGTNPVSGEETEICIRITNKIPEAILIYEPEAIVYHKVPSQRQGIKYIIKRAFAGGLSLGLIYDMHKNNRSILNTETNYLRHLLKALFKYMRDIFRIDPVNNITRVCLLVIVTICTALGFFRSKLIKNKFGV